MFTTCLFCHAPLGSNQTIEHFPVGKRLAYDAEQGRLWVVCPKCERWNLSPLEECWEAIEEAERQYRATTRRVATDNIALARLRDGLELVRIGRPLRPDFAAWRYGDQFGRRRRKLIGYSALGVAVAGGVLIGGPAVGLGLGSFNLPIQLYNLGYNYWLPAVRVHDAQGRVLRLSRQQLYAARWAPGDGAPQLTFDYQHFTASGSLVSRLGFAERPTGTKARAELTGDTAVRAVAAMLPVLNRGGGGARDVESAVQLVESAGALPTLFDRAARAERRSALGVMAWTGSSVPKNALFHLSRPVRLALEMALHEDDERRAMASELGALYARWEEAERVARIADRELTPLASGDAMVTDQRD
jgi:hypothetical protein